MTETPEDPQRRLDEGTQVALELTQGLLEAQRSTIDQLLEITAHMGLHRLSERLRDMWEEGYEHIGILELFRLIEDVHKQLDEPKESM